MKIENNYIKQKSVRKAKLPPNFNKNVCFGPQFQRYNTHTVHSCCILNLNIGQGKS